MTSLSNKNIVLAVTGSIAAYKSAEIIRALQVYGAKVKVVMTNSATKFITPLTLESLSGFPIYLDLFHESSNDSMQHIQLSRWADIIMIAPCSADTMANLTTGGANSFLTSLCLASQVPLVLIPAMNHAMWNNPATQTNYATLTARGIHIWGPKSGVQACGETGIGHILDIEQIVKQLIAFLNHGLLAGKKIIITAGPTFEYIDPVRYIANASSGKMGFALAVAAVQAGADVTLIAGPTNLPDIKNTKRINIISAHDMFTAVKNELLNCNIFIGVAAVADYKPSVYLRNKINKQQQWELKLEKNIDIIQYVAQHKNIFTVGFAAQSDNTQEYADAKLQQKKLDLIIANDISNPATGFGSDNNEVNVLWRDGKQDFPLQSKHKLASELIKLIAQRISI